MSFLVFQLSRWEERKKERGLVALILLCSECHIFLRLILAVPWFTLWFVIVACSDHAYLLYHFRS